MTLLLKEILWSNDARLDALSQSMYGTDFAGATQMLGVQPSFTRGYAPGQVDPNTNQTYSINGQSTDEFGNVSYSSFNDFVNAMSASSKSGWMGGEEDAKKEAAKGNTKAQAYLDNLPSKKEEDKKPEVKTETTSSEDSTPSGGSTGAVGSTGDLGGATGAGYSGSQDLADSYAESGGDAGAGSDSFGGSVGADGGYATAKGGFIKKPKPKPKKMKRGGLASKK